jgi:hypothetical protein
MPSLMALRRSNLRPHKHDSERARDLTNTAHDSAVVLYHTTSSVRADVISLTNTTPAAYSSKEQGRQDLLQELVKSAPQMLKHLERPQNRLYHKQAAAARLSSF